MSKRGSRYKEAILEQLGRAQAPLDVEKIRVGCEIGNWQTALKHCLELLYEDKIRGIKTSKSWVFWSDSSDPALPETKARKVSSQ